VACFLVGCLAFFVWAPWTTAIPVADATLRYPGQVNPNWRAVTLNHNRPHEWRWGTVDENPLGFAACSVVLALSVGGFFYGAYRCRPLVGNGGRRTNGGCGLRSRQRKRVRRGDWAAFGSTSGITGLRLHSEARDAIRCPSGGSGTRRGHGCPSTVSQFLTDPGSDARARCRRCSCSRRWWW